MPAVKPVPEKLLTAVCVALRSIVRSSPLKVGFRVKWTCAGLPESALELAAQAARSEGHEGATPEAGPWSFGLDFPSYFPVMTHAKNRCARPSQHLACVLKSTIATGWYTECLPVASCGHAGGQLFTRWCPVIQASGGSCHVCSLMKCNALQALV